MASNNEDRDELIQEALFKLHKLFLKQPDQDFKSEDSRKHFYVVTKNIMLDYIRSMKRKKHASKISIEEEHLNNRLISNCLTQTQILQAKSVLQESQSQLSDLEIKILSLLIKPNQEYNWFIRKVNVLEHVAKNKMKLLFRTTPESKLIRKYLNINTKQYQEALNKIRNVVELLN